MREAKELALWMNGPTTPESHWESANEYKLEMKA
jgi:hypothetical protein